VLQLSDDHLRRQAGVQRSELHCPVLRKGDQATVALQAHPGKDYARLAWRVILRRF